MNSTSLSEAEIDRTIAHTVSLGALSFMYYAFGISALLASGGLVLVGISFHY